MSSARPRARATLVAIALVLSGVGAAACSDDGDDGGEGADALRAALTSDDPGATEDQADCIVDALQEDGITDEQMGDVAANIEQPPDDPELAAAVATAAGECVPED